jgi:plasmid stability protein
VATSSKSVPRRTASITIRNLAPALKERLRVRAAQHGHSMEAEARRILEMGVFAPEPPAEDNLFDRIRARVAKIGGIREGEIPIQPRSETKHRPLPKFD